MLAAKDELFTRPSGGYTIARSVRLRNSASAYLNRTPASAGNQKTWTMSFWLKRGSLSQSRSGVYSTTGAVDYIEFGGGYGQYDFEVTFNNASGARIATNALYRDPAAWYHFVIATDTTQSTASNRILLYVNGVQITSFVSASYPSQNYNTAINSAVAQYIGADYNLTSGQYFDGYMTEFNFIDGQQLTPSSFGTTNSITGVWQPAKYTGTYGTNGFYLNFSDNSAVTTSSNVGIGKDFSGNGNYWTSNNINVTAYSGSPSNNVNYDSMVDSPTVGSLSSNYCVVDVLSPIGSASALSTVSSANLQLTHSGSTYSQRFGNMVVSSGKWYFEFTLTNIGYPSLAVGVSKLSRYPTYTGGGGQATSCAAVGYFTGADLNVFTEAGGAGAGAISSQTWSNGDIIMVAFSIDTGKIWWGKNGTWYSSGNPAADTNNITTITSSGAEYRPWAVLYGTTTDTSFNFGQRPFSYSPPTGFNALNTYNLPTSTITNGAAYMAASTYTGNLTGQSITNGGNNTLGTTFQPDLVWIKSRSAATDNKLTDSVRGATKALISNTTAAETTDTTGVTAINSNGFTLGISTVYNNTATTYVAWQWLAGASAGSSNTSGSITSSVSANTTAGFSVVTYTGTGANATVGHGLGVAPSMIILKQRNAVDYWTVWHTTLGSTGYLLLNSTNASSTAATYWNSTLPTSSVFSLGSDSRPNGSTITYVAYCFAAVKGYSAFGSYTGNSSSDGPFVYLGFRPRYILVKCSSSTEAGEAHWECWDTSRTPYNVSNQIQYLDLNTAESTSAVFNMDILSNGFKLRPSAFSYGNNASGQTYIYAAFAENPFQNALAR